MIRENVEELSPLERLTLVLLAAPSGRDQHAGPIPGRTHLAKELFLLWKNPVFAGGLKSVRFEPGRYGPWTEAIAVALDELSARDLISQGTGRASPVSLTEKGKRFAATLWTASSEKERAVLTDVKTNLNSLPTDTLLARIYAAYPEFAVASEWQRRSEK